jgi:dienelactone hydrolase
VYPSRNGEYTEREGLATTEPVSGRQLPLLVRVPSGSRGPQAAVIWMHGGGFNDNGHREGKAWGDMLAKHGYVVIHVASSFPDAESGLKMCAKAAVPRHECHAGDEDANGLLTVFRSLDLGAVLDDLPRLSRLSAAAGGPEIDMARVAVGGWSGGSRAPMIAMGATTKPSESAPMYFAPHPLPAVAFGMSPSGPPFGGWFDEGGKSSWSTMRGPYLMATGGNDVKPGKPELTGEIRRLPFQAQPGDGKRWLLYSNLAVGVGGHGTYNLGDLNSNDERVTRLSEAIASVTRAFLDAYLRDDAKARAWLDSGNAKVLAGAADWEHR